MSMPMPGAAAASKAFEIREFGNCGNLRVAPRVFSKISSARTMLRKQPFGRVRPTSRPQAAAGTELGRAGSDRSPPTAPSRNSDSVYGALKKTANGYAASSATAALGAILADRVAREPPDIHRPHAKAMSDTSTPPQSIRAIRRSFGHAGREGAERIAGGAHRAAETRERTRRSAACRSAPRSNSRRARCRQYQPASKRAGRLSSDVGRDREADRLAVRGRSSRPRDSRRQDSQNAAEERRPRDRGGRFGLTGTEARGRRGGAAARRETPTCRTAMMRERRRRAGVPRRGRAAAPDRECSTKPPKSRTKNPSARAASAAASATREPRRDRLRRSSIREALYCPAKRLFLDLHAAPHQVAEGGDASRPGDRARASRRARPASSSATAT